jgi:hypothetical protein
MLPAVCMACIYVCICGCVFMQMNTDAFSFMNYIYVCMRVHVCMQMHLHTLLYAYKYVCMNVCS